MALLGTAALSTGLLGAVAGTSLWSAGETPGTISPSPPAAAPQFRAPAAGTYALPPIQWAPRGRVLDVDGRERSLDAYTGGAITLLGFMYTYCSDPVGCPLAFSTFDGLRRRLAADPRMAGRVRLVSLSFDPANDTPEAMRRYAGPLAAASAPVRWHFLTTVSVEALAPIIDGFGQTVQVQLDWQGRPGRLFYHMLKVFLLDARGQVREIYSPAFLQPEVMYNDIETLLLEEGPATR